MPSNRVLNLISNTALLVMFSKEDSITVSLGSDCSPDIEEADWGVSWVIDQRTVSAMEYYSRFNSILSRLVNTDDGELSLYPMQVLDNSSINLGEFYYGFSSLRAISDRVEKLLSWEKQGEYFVIVGSGKIDDIPIYLPVGSKIPCTIFEEHKDVLATLFLLLGCPSGLKALYWGSASRVLGSGLYKARKLILDWYGVEVPKRGFFELPWPSYKLSGLTASSYREVVYNMSNSHFVSRCISLIYTLEKTRFASLIGVTVDPNQNFCMSEEDRNLVKTSYVRLSSIATSTITINKRSYYIPSQDLYPLAMLLGILDLKSQGTEWFERTVFHNYHCVGDYDSRKLFTDITKNTAGVYKAVSSIKEIASKLSDMHSVSFVPNMFKRWALTLYKRSSKLEAPPARFFPKRSHASKGYYQLVVRASKADFNTLYGAASSLCNIMYLEHYSESMRAINDIGGSRRGYFAGYGYLAKAMFHDSLKQSLEEKDFLVNRISNLKSDSAVMWGISQKDFVERTVMHYPSITRGLIRLLKPYRHVVSSDSIDQGIPIGHDIVLNRGTSEEEVFNAANLYQEAICALVSDVLEIPASESLEFRFHELKDKFKASSFMEERYKNKYRSLRYIKVHSSTDLEDLYTLVWQNDNATYFVKTQVALFIVHLLPQVLKLLEVELLRWDCLISTVVVDAESICLDWLKEANCILGH